MIAAVRGEVMVRRPDHVVIDAAGVGYRLAVSAETLKAVPATGRDAFLHAELIARDDSLALYGFASEEERDLFGELISVSGIGPKVALAALSGGPVTRASAGDRRRRRKTLSGRARDRQTDLGADHRRAAREGRRRAGGGGRPGGPPTAPTRAALPATAWSTSATRRWRPSSCSTASRAARPRSWSPPPCARPARRGARRERDRPPAAFVLPDRSTICPPADEVRVHDARADVPDEDLDRSLRPRTLADFVNQVAGHRAAGDLHRGRARPRRAARPRPARRPAGPRQDLARPHRRRGDGRADGADGRPGPGAQGRRRLLPHRAGARQRLLRRRDPPPRPGGRGDALPGDGGRRAAGRARPGRRRAHRDAAAAAVHAGRRDHPRRPADDAAARPLRRLATGSSTTAPSTWPRSSCAPPASSGSRSTPRERRRSPPARAARRGSRTGCSSGCATSPRSRTAARSTARSPPPRWRCSRSTPAGSTAATEPCSTPSRPSSPAGRSGSRPWPSRSARSRTRSRTCSSPTCSSRACSSAPRAGRVLTPRAYDHLGLPVPDGARSLF